MASRKSRPNKAAKKGRSFYPVMRGTELGVSGALVQQRILDVPAVLSQINRRLYRYSRCYQVKLDLKISEPGSYEVYALRNDWAVHQSLKMAYEHYLKNTDDERKALGKNMIARWEDFRIDDGVQGATNSLTGKTHSFNGFTGSLHAAGSFPLSTVTEESGTERTFTWGALAGNQYNVLTEYNKSANVQKSPEGDTNDGAYSALDDDVDQSTYQNLQEDGAEPPYNSDGANESAPFVKIATIGTNAVGAQKMSTGYFDAPCGLVVVVGPSSDWPAAALTFEVRSGDYKGVHAPSMLE